MRRTRLMLALFDNERLTFTLPDGREMDVRITGRDANDYGRSRVCIEAPADVTVVRESAGDKRRLARKETEHAG